MEGPRDDLLEASVEAEEDFAFLQGKCPRKGPRGRRMPRQTIPPSTIAHLDVAKKEWKMEGADEEQLVIEALFELQQQSNGSARLRQSSGTGLDEVATQQCPQPAVDDRTQHPGTFSSWESSQRAQRALYQHLDAELGNVKVDGHRRQARPSREDAAEGKSLVRTGSGSQSPSGSKRRRAWHGDTNNNALVNPQAVKTAVTVQGHAMPQSNNSPTADGAVGLSSRRHHAGAAAADLGTNSMGHRQARVPSPAAVKRSQTAQTASGTPQSGCQGGSPSNGHAEVSQGMQPGVSLPGYAAQAPGLPAGLFPNLAALVPYLAKMVTSVTLPNGMQLPVMVTPDGQLLPLPGWPAIPGSPPSLAGPSSMVLPPAAMLPPMVGKPQVPGQQQQPPQEQQLNSAPAGTGSPRKQGGPMAMETQQQHGGYSMAVGTSRGGSQAANNSADDVADGWTGPQGPGYPAGALPAAGTHASARRCLIHVHIAHFIHAKQQAAKAGLQATVRATIIPSRVCTPCTAAPAGVEAESSSGDLDGQERGCQRRRTAADAAAIAPRGASLAATRTSEPQRPLQAGAAQAQAGAPPGDVQAPSSPAAQVLGDAQPPSRARISSSPSPGKPADRAKYPSGALLQSAGSIQAKASVLPWGFPPAAQLAPGIFQAMQSMYAGQIMASTSQIAMPVASMSTTASTALNNGEGARGFMDIKPGHAAGGIPTLAGPAVGTLPLPFPLMPAVLPFLPGLPMLPSLGPASPQAAAVAAGSVAASAAMAALAGCLKAAPVGLMATGTGTLGATAAATSSPALK